MFLHTTELLFIYQEPVLLITCVEIGTVQLQIDV